MSKVKILLVAANPVGTPPLQLDVEVRDITAKIRASEYRDSLELVSRWAVRPDDLLQSLLEVKPHVVHFSGHGGNTEELFLESDDGRRQPVSKKALAELFRTLKDNIRVVLLNACTTEPQAEALAQTIDCVIGMSWPISDHAAVVFAASFYRALGFGRSVQEAFELGRIALLLEGIPEEETPRMHVRDGVDAAALTLIASKSEPVENAIPSRATAAANSIRPLPSVNRLQFVKTLAGLGPADFEILVAAIPEAARQVGRHGSIPERAAELIRWAESSHGCGLSAVEEALENFC